MVKIINGVIIIEVMKISINGEISGEMKNNVSNNNGYHHVMAK
jgi:hypothetical protein